VFIGDLQIVLCRDRRAVSNPLANTHFDHHSQVRERDIIGCVVRRESDTLGVRLGTTGGGAITVSAGGNIALGALTAGNALGAVTVTSTFGGILFSNPSTPTNPNVIASSTTLSIHTQPVASNQSVALAQLHATQVIAGAWFTVLVAIGPVVVLVTRVPLTGL
jgi:hypothetical protein